MPELKSKTPRPKKGRKADRYLWYWKPPFSDPNSPHYFQRQHWWKQSRNDASHDSAIYELLRRHPDMGELQRRICLSKEYCSTSHQVADEIRYCALRSWINLSEREKVMFQKSLSVAYPGKGRNLTRRVFDLTEEALIFAELERDVGGPCYEDFIGKVTDSYASEDRFIVAVSTNFESREKAKTALKRITEIFWSYWRPGLHVRAHWENWFSVIQTFESEFAKDGASKFKLGYPRSFKAFVGLFRGICIKTSVSTSSE